MLAALLRSAPVVTSAAILAATATPAEASTPPSAVVEPITQPDTRFLGVSPDGHLVAALEEGDDPLVCALDVPTLDEVACDELPAVRLDDRSVRWSPDSTAFAFTEQSFVDLTDGDLWVFDITGGGVPRSHRRRVLRAVDRRRRLDRGRHPAGMVAGQFDDRVLRVRRSPTAHVARRSSASRRAGAPATTIADVSDVPGAVYLGLVWPKADTIIYSRSEPRPRRSSQWRLPPRDGRRFHGAAGGRGPGVGAAGDPGRHP